MYHPIANVQLNRCYIETIKRGPSSPPCYHGYCLTSQANSSKARYVVVCFGSTYSRFIWFHFYWKTHSQTSSLPMLTHIVFWHRKLCSSRCQHSKSTVKIIYGFCCYRLQKTNHVLWVCCLFFVFFCCFVLFCFVFVCLFVCFCLFLLFCFVLFCFCLGTSNDAMLFYASDIGIGKQLNSKQLNNTSL